MGLGKTVEVLSLMLCNPRKKVAVPETLEPIYLENTKIGKQRKSRRRSPSPVEFELKTDVEIEEEKRLKEKEEALKKAIEEDEERAEEEILNDEDAGTSGEEDELPEEAGGRPKKQTEEQMTFADLNRERSKRDFGRSLVQDAMDEESRSNEVIIKADPDEVVEMIATGNMDEVGDSEDISEVAVSESEPQPGTSFAPELIQAPSASIEVKSEVIEAEMA